MSEIVDFSDFINRYKQESLNLDLVKEYPMVYARLEEQKLKLSSADFASEIDEVIAFCEKAVKETKQSLRNSFANQHYKGAYVSGNPPFLSEIKTYFEYLQLYDDAITAKNKLQELRTTTPLQQNDIDKYIESYKHHYFSSIIGKRDKDNKENILFYGKITADLLKQRNNELVSKENLKDRYNLLSEYNKHLYYLTGHTMQLFKGVNNYLNTRERGCLTGIKIKEDDVFNSLKNIKDFTKVIKHNCIDGEILIASKIRDYCVLMFDDWIDLLNDNFGIDIYKSPLKAHFENVKKALQNSINLDELKIISELNKITAEEPQQSEAKKELKTEKINAPVLALFCSLINEIGIDKKEEAESVQKYCKRICEKYGFLYTDRVRQNYSGNKTKEVRKVFIEKVLPLLEIETKSKIQKLLDTKYPPKQNLYA